MAEICAKPTAPGRGKFEPTGGSVTDAAKAEQRHSPLRRKAGETQNG